MRLSIILAICFVGVCSAETNDRVKRFLDPFAVLKALAYPEEFAADVTRIIRNKMNEPREEPRNKRDVSYFDNVDKNKVFELMYGLMSKLNPGQKYEYNPDAVKVFNFMNNEEWPDVIKQFAIMLEEMKDQNPNARKIWDFVNNYGDDFYGDFFRMLAEMADAEPRNKRDVSYFDNVDKNKVFEIMYGLLSKLNPGQKYEYNPDAVKVLNFINNAEDPDYAIRDFFIMLEEMKDQNPTARKIMDFINAYDEDAFYGDFFRMLLEMRDGQTRSERSVQEQAQ